MISKETFRKSILAVAGLAALLQLVGCGIANPILSDGPSPRAEDCMLLQQATPTKFVCDGKTYTAVQLADIRHGKAAEAK